jgi:hypothetical protein
MAICSLGEAYQLFGDKQLVKQSRRFILHYLLSIAYLA